MTIGDSPNPHEPGTRAYFSYAARLKKQAEDRRRREELRRRNGLHIFFRKLGEMVYRAYPHGQIFDIHTGELIVFEERPGLFIQAAIREAQKAQDEWIKEKEGC